VKQALAGLVLMLACTALYGVDSGEDFADPILQARYEHLIHELRCLVCQNESIADSNAPLAADLRREVREMLGAGKQDAEILHFMTDRYGDFVLFRPPFVARTWVLWLAPILLLLAGAGIAARIIRQRHRLARADSDDSDLETGPP
jgi:cytochrome c-type biogenesis protein CcmH